MAVSLKPEVIIGTEHLGLTNSMITALVILVLLVLFFVLYTPKISIKPRSKFQLFIEWSVTGISNLAESVIGKKMGQYYFPIIFTFFVFIITSNWFGLLPFVGSLGFAHHVKEGTESLAPTLVFDDGLHFTKAEEIHAPFFRAPSSDLNFTIALGILAFVIIQFAALKSLGLAHLGKFFDWRVKIGKGWRIILTPFAFLANAGFKLLELILEFSRIISFAFRLFGNIFAGEILLFVVTSLTFGLVTLPFLGLELFVGFIQAIVFISLLMVLIKVSSEAHH